MDAQQFIVMVVAGSILSPFITSIINRPSWSRGLRQGVAAAVAVAVAVVANLGTGGFTGQWYMDLVTVLGSATFAYEAIWKPTGAAAFVETATTPSNALR